jgi:hypothetical protein
MTQKRQTLKPILAYPNKSIAQLHLQINQQLAILGQIKSALPTELQVHVLHSVLNGKKLIIYTDSGNWASQLRFYGKTMLTAIDAAPSKSVAIIQVRIINDATTSKSPKPKGIIPSQTVIYSIRNQSQLTTDPQLKQMFDKLSVTLARLRVRGEK